MGWVDWSVLGREQQSSFRGLACTGAVKQQSFKGLLGLEQLSSSRLSEIGLDWAVEQQSFRGLAWTGAVVRQSLFTGWLGLSSWAAVVQRLAWTEQLSNSRSEFGLDWAVEQQLFRGWLGLSSWATVVQRLAWTEQLSSSRSEIGLDWSRWAAVKAEEGECKAWHFFEQR